MDIQKILIIRLSSIGDIILTTPLIRCVRKEYPKAQIDFVVKAQFQDLVATNPHLSNVIVFDKDLPGRPLKELRKKIRKGEYDWIIDIHRNFRSLYLRLGSGAGLVTGYPKKIFYRSMLVYLGINIYPKVESVMVRYFVATRKQGIEYDGLGTEVLVPNELEAELSNRIPAKNQGAKIIAICPGASFGNKRWLPQRFLEVAKYYADHYRAQIVFLGGPGDEALCTGLANQIDGALNLAGQLSLLQSAAVLKTSSLIITNDSGMMHLAQSQQVPVVAIFGPTTRELGYFPLPERSAVVEADVSCRPCTHNGLDKCPKGHFRCMNEISTEMVLDASRKVFMAIPNSEAG